MAYPTTGYCKFKVKPIYGADFIQVEDGTVVPVFSYDVNHYIVSWIHTGITKTEVDAIIAHFVASGGNDWGFTDFTSDDWVLVYTAEPSYSHIAGDAWEVKVVCRGMKD